MPYTLLILCLPMYHSCSRSNTHFAVTNPNPYTMTFDIVGSRRLFISANLCIFCLFGNFILVSGRYRNRFTFIRRFFKNTRAEQGGDPENQTEPLNFHLATQITEQKPQHPIWWKQSRPPSPLLLHAVTWRNHNI